jgi:hypothetical protein
MISSSLGKWHTTRRPRALIPATRVWVMMEGAPAQQPLLLKNLPSATYEVRVTLTRENEGTRSATTARGVHSRSGVCEDGSGRLARGTAPQTCPSSSTS